MGQLTKRHIILFSGKDSLATALLQTTREPSLSYEFIFCDVEAELPETYAWIERVEQKTGWKIKRIGQSVTARIDGRNQFLPSPKARYCTGDCKIEPLEEYLGTDEAMVYYGLRADENRTGYIPAKKARITPCYPLQEMGIDLRGVYSILDAQNLMPPNFFWPRLYEAVSQRLQGWNDWESKLTRMQRDLLFAGRSRGNCFLCFYQRQYEYVWLYETHPELFERTAAFEKNDYTWQKGHTLKQLMERRDVIFENRVKDVCKSITRLFQMQIFETQDNEIALTSCGLLCGK